MRKSLKICGAIVSAIAFVLLTVFVVASYVVDDEFILRIMQESVMDSTGHNLEINGEFAFERSLRPGVVADDVYLSNLSASPSPEIVTADHVRFRIELLPLLTGDLRFAVIMEKPRVYLSVDATGRRNWQAAGANQARGGNEDSGFDLDIGYVEILDGRVIYQDARDGSNVEVEIKTLVLDYDRTEGLAALELRCSYQDEDYSVYGSLRGAADDTPLQAELQIDGYAAADQQTPGAPEFRLVSSGSVSRPDQDPAFDLVVDGELRNLRWLVESFDLTPGDWAELGPLSAKARFQLEHGEYGVKELDVALNQQGGAMHGHDTGLTAEGLALRATGSVSDLGNANEIDLELSAAADTLSELSRIPPLSQLSLPGTGQVTASGRLVGRGGHYGIDDFNASLNSDSLSLTATGKVTDLSGEPEAQFGITGRIGDLSGVPEMLGISLNLPPVGPIDASADILSSKGEHQLQQLNVEWQQEGVHASIAGDVAKLSTDPEATLQLKLQADSLDALSVLIQKELPAIGPLSLNSALNIDRHHYRVSGLEVRVADSDLSGKISLTRGEEPPQLVASLSSQKLDLDQLLSARAPPEVEEHEEQDNQEKPGREPTKGLAESAEAKQDSWLSTEPVDLSALYVWNGRIDVRIDRVVEAGDTFDDTVLHVRLDNGLFRIPQMRMLLEGGELSMSASVDARQSPPAYQYRNEIKDVPIGALFGLPEAVVIGGPTTGFIELQGNGHSPAEIFSSLNGGLLLQMGRARMVEVGLATVSDDLLAGLLRGISGSEDKQPYTDYICGTFGVQIEDGIATMNRSIALQTKRFNVGGRGLIDLRKGRIELEMRPRARKGFGVSASMLTGGFKISGNLETAKAGLSLKGLLESAMMGSFAGMLAVDPSGGVATGTVLFLRGMWDRLTAGAFSCERTLKRIEKRARDQSFLFDNP